MKYIFVNLKRFDVPEAMGGINRYAPVTEWGGKIVAECQKSLGLFRNQAKFTFFFPEAHLLKAIAAKSEDSYLTVGCQGVYREDISSGGNFGAFTTNRPAASVRAMGCEEVMIGHCEERRDKAGILAEAGIIDTNAVSRILNREIICAIGQGLRVLYCIGETIEEQSHWQDVLQAQLEIGLMGLSEEERNNVVIGYEPVWAIGPGKVPPNREYIQMIAAYIKKATNGLPVVYGGGLKADNAVMLASIAEVDGGLIGLTRFSGEIGFYPDEYLEIVQLYLQG